MKQFTHKFELIAASQIHHQYEQFVTLVDDPKILSLFAQSPITIEQSSEKSSSGIYYKVNFQAVTKDPLVDEFNKKHAVIRITLSDGSILYLGDKSDPIIIMVTPHQNSFMVEAEFSTQKSLKF